MKISPWPKRPDAVTARFISVIAIFVVIGICVLSLDRLQARIMTSVRAYVAGEGFYSKAQKDAVNHLQRYASTLNPAQYHEFLDNIAVPLGDHRARLALQQFPPDLQRARQGFIAGGNNPDDVDHMIWLFVDFHNYGAMKKAIAIWTHADAQVALLVQLGQKMHLEITSGNSNGSSLESLMKQVEANNRILAQLENQFSTILGITSNKIDHFAGILIISATLGLLTLGIILSTQIVQRVRRAQELLIASEARFRQIADSNIIGIMFGHGNGVIYDANDAFLNLIGYDRNDLGKFTWMDITPEAYTDRDKQAVSEVASNGTCEPYEKRLIRRDGSLADVVVGAARLDAEPDSGLCFVLDVSERRRLQERIVQAQRMESIGTLVGGLAHDFNNTLSAMLGNVHLARTETKDLSAINRRLDNMEELSSHSARIVNQLMAFARKSVSQMSPVSLNELVGDVHERAADSIPAQIEFNTTITAEPLVVVGDSVQLQRVMLNLIENAQDAVAGTPNARISCMLDRYRPEGRKTHSTPVGAAGMAHLVVRDNGAGMSMETQSRAFEPFFTTKSVAEASGLGLSTVYGVVQSHEGDVWIESTPGKGTHIHVLLPLSTSSPNDAEPMTASNPGAEKHNATILLVDDHADIRNICQRFLEANGQTVVTAEDGVSAVEIFETHLNEIELLITDVVMPMMSGTELADRLRGLKPDLPVLFMTGYDPERAISKALDDRCKVITKPFSNMEFIHSVNEMLNAGDA